MKYTSHKGQILSFDFLIACSVFILAISILYVFWIHEAQKINEIEMMNDMINKAHLVSQIWFREGTPEYWNASNVVDLGLENDHRFNQTKMDLMNTSIGYEKTKKLLGIEDYDIFFRVYNTTNNTLFTFGLYPDKEAENVVKTKRIGIFNSNIVMVEVILWK